MFMSTESFYKIVQTAKHSLPSPVDWKSKGVHQMGNWEEEMDALLSARPFPIR